MVMVMVGDGQAGEGELLNVRRLDRLGVVVDARDSVAETRATARWREGLANSLCM